MPSFSATLPVVAIATGNQILLVNNASTDSGITATTAVSMAVEPSGNNTLTLVNTTNQTATVQVAAVNTNASFVPLSNNATAVTAVTNTAVSFTCNGPYVRCTYSVAPTTGSLTLTR